MADKTVDAKKRSGKAAREARLAKALRDNLRRRKEAAKAAKPTPGKS
jgi:hypothetical protein